MAFGIGPSANFMSKFGRSMGNMGSAMGSTIGGMGKPAGMMGSPMSASGGDATPQQTPNPMPPPMMGGLGRRMGQTQRPIGGGMMGGGMIQGPSNFGQAMMGGAGLMPPMQRPGAEMPQMGGGGPIWKAYNQMNSETGVPNRQLFY